MKNEMLHSINVNQESEYFVQLKSGMVYTGKIGSVNSITLVLINAYNEKVGEITQVGFNLNDVEAFGILEE